MEGPDHSSSFEPTEFKELVYGIRQIEICLGNGLKIPSSDEEKNIQGMKRSLTAKTNIKKGQVITADMIGFKRPATGLHVNMYYEIVGKQASTDIQENTTIQKNMIVW